MLGESAARARTHAHTYTRNPFIYLMCAHMHAHMPTKLMKPWEQLLQGTMHY